MLTRSLAVLQLATITAPFFSSLGELGEFEEVEAAELPADYQTLLAHDDHMTVTVEAYHGSLVDVRVLEERREGEVYTRASLLVAHADRRVVQFGIMRINLAGLSDVVRREIEQRSAPLGRILIRHNVLRHVRLFKLWRIRPGAVLAEHLALASFSETRIEPGSDSSISTDRAEAREFESRRDLSTGSFESRRDSATCIYGRSAGIVVEGRPAVELLEIVKA